MCYLEYYGVYYLSDAESRIRYHIFPPGGSNAVPVYAQGSYLEKLQDMQIHIRLQLSSYGGLLRHKDFH